ncbi:hypothetical protein D3C85_1478690 [compost metagenome]
MERVHQHPAICSIGIFDDTHCLFEIACIGPWHEFQVRMKAVGSRQVTKSCEVFGEPLLVRIVTRYQ